MLVFRPGRRALSGNALLRALLPLVRDLNAPSVVPSAGLKLEALLRCGELECGLADLDSPDAATVAAATNTLAELLLGSPSTVPLSQLVGRLACIGPPRSEERRVGKEWSCRWSPIP